MRVGKPLALAAACVLRRLVPLLLLAATPGCFFTDPINGRPAATIEDRDPKIPLKDAEIWLSARKSDDPDDDPLSYQWTASSCVDTTSCTVFQNGGSVEFTFKIPDKRLVIVGLTVEDEHGARNYATLSFTPVNQLPTATIQLQYPPPNGAGAYTVGRKLTFAAGASDADQDPLTIAWNKYPPPGSDPESVEWTTSDEEATLRTDVPGLWTIEVTATDTDDATAVDDIAFMVVDDQPPCIAATDPAAITGARYILTRDDGPRRFSVETVTDDLDPYPLPASPDEDLGGARFRWFVAGPGAGAPFVEVPGHDLHDLVIDPAIHAPGDVLGLRVEITDRVLRPSCDAAEPTCPAGGGSCLQRVSWTVEVR